LLQIDTIMETPFVFGKIAEGIEFTDRNDETKELIANFTSGTNTILLSPRRWGKSSLVLKAADLANKKNKKMVFCFIDLYNVRAEEQFYQTLAQEVLRSTSGKLDEMLQTAKKYLAHLMPKFTVSPDESNSISLGLDWKEVEKQPEEILNMAEKIALSKKIRILICIDEFQNIAEFANPLAFQKKLRANWQKHQNASYCLYGSKRHMLLNVFSSPSAPFYKFGNLLLLEKISTSDLAAFIIKRFLDTHKKIEPEEAILITQKVECHTYYVQQLAQQAWLRTNKLCSLLIIEAAFESLLMQLSLLFQIMTDSLPTTQLNFLKAVIDNVQKLSSSSIIKNYGFGTSANVLRIKQALIEKEILDIQGEKIMFLDPMYKHWLNRYFYKN
jgi:hypothetical protein